MQDALTRLQQQEAESARLQATAQAANQVSYNLKLGTCIACGQCARSSLVFSLMH